MGNLNLEELMALGQEAKMRLAQLTLPHNEAIPSDIPSLLHELHVHKIELEMQNDELQKSNLELEESSQSYKDLYEFAPIGYLSINDQDLITKCNLKALSMFGINHQNLNKYRFAQFVDDKYKAIWHNIFLTIKNQGEGEGEEISFDIQLINNEGVNFYAHLNCLRVNNCGESEMIRLVFIDITDQKLADEKQKADQEKHQVLLNTAMDGFWINDEDGQFLEVNATYCQMSGYKQSELLKMKVSDIEANESVIDIAAHIKKVISTGSDRFDTKHRRKDGSIFDVRVNVQYMHSEGGQFVVFLQDITSMKTIADQLASLQVAQHVLEGTKKQLQKALDSERNFSVAVGIIMGQQQVGKDTAINLLRKRAREENLKLNELATILVNAREILNFENRL
jgi:PAS domain S-box-containing protein